MGELTDDILAAYVHVEQMVPKSDGRSGPAPWWYGWALRESFIAGVKWQKNKEITPVRLPCIIKCRGCGCDLAVTDLCDVCEAESIDAASMDYGGAEACDICKGQGDVIRRTARQIGYTFGPEESADSLEERFESCPQCHDLSEPETPAKRYYVDFYDMIDGWGSMPDFRPERRFDDFDEAKDLCKKLQSELGEANKRCGEHYGVIDLQGHIAHEVFCAKDTSC